MKRFWWGLRVSSPGSPKHNLLKIGEKMGAKIFGQKYTQSHASSSVLCLYTVRDALVFVFFGWLFLLFFG